MENNTERKILDALGSVAVRVHHNEYAIGETCRLLVTVMIVKRVLWARFFLFGWESDIFYMSYLTDLHANMRQLPALICCDSWNFR